MKTADGSLTTYDGKPLVYGEPASRTKMAGCYLGEGAALSVINEEIILAAGLSSLLF